MRLHLVVQEGDHWASEPARAALVTRLGSASGDTRLTWDEQVQWDEERALLRVSCIGRDADLPTLEAAAIADLATAAAAVLPARDRIVRVARVGLVMPTSPPLHSTRERWGWYRVGLLVEAAWLRDDPASVSYVREWLSRFQRFTNASFACDTTHGSALMSVETVARSPNAADAEARAGFEALVSAAGKNGAERHVQTVELRWLREPEVARPGR